MWLSFDIPEADDLQEEHILHADGTMEYTQGSRERVVILKKR